MRITSGGVVEIPGANDVAQSSAKLDVRVNGSAIEFGHTNNTDKYFGTLGSYGSNGSPFISFSCMNELSTNTWTTKSTVGNIINGDNSGNLCFQQVTSTNTTGQTPTERMRIDSAGDVTIQTSGADDIKNFTINSSNGSSQVAGFIIQNDGANGYIHFKAGSGGATPTTKLTIGNAANSGNVGIGTTSPQRHLVLYEDSSGQTQIQFQNSTTGAAAGDGFGVGLDSSEKGFLWNYEGTDTYIGGAGGTSITIQNGGNVGIGTTSPGALLEITGTGDAIRVESTNTGAGGAQVDLLHFTTSPADNDTFAYVNMGGYYTGTSSVYGTSIRGVWSDVSARDAELQFWTNNSGTLTEVMSITSEGNLVLDSQSTSTATTELNKIVFRKCHGSGCNVAQYDQASIRAKTFGGYEGGLNFYTSRNTGGGNYADTFAMAIDYDGNVGIGTETMYQLLNLTSLSNATTLIQFRTADDSEVMNFGIGADVGYQYMESNTPMTFGTNTIERI